VPCRWACSRPPRLLVLGIQPTAATMVGASTSVAPEAVVAGVVVDAETAKSAVVATVVTSEALGKASAPPPTKGHVPAVPMGYKAHTEAVLTTGNLLVCCSNVGFVVLALLLVWFGIIIENDVLTGSLLPTPSPPPPPAPPQAPMTCPFDVAACNRQCALMHVDCVENNTLITKAKKKRPCDADHGMETANRSTAAFNTVQTKKAYLESLDWANESTLWGLREEQIGDGRCDRSGCGATLCECSFDGGDCAPEPWSGTMVEQLSYPFGILTFGYLVTMYVVIVHVIGDHLKAPKLRDEGELTAYVTKMQREQLQVSFSVVCSHTTGSSKPKTSHTGTGSKKTIVTHRSSHPFAYAASTDVSTLAQSWLQPAGGGSGWEGSLGTGSLAVVSSKLSWKPAKGKTADKLEAERRRLKEENKHRDSECTVTVKATLPGQKKDQLYAPAGGATKRLPLVAELLLVLLGLGAPLYFYYARRLSRHIEHTVDKTIYIEGHAAPAASGGGVSRTV
jgi:hypothetical protein